MRSRPTADHQDAVARRLALLSAELAATGAAPVPPGAVDDGARTAGGATPYDVDSRHPRRPASRAGGHSAHDPSEPPRTRDAVDDAPPPVPRPGRHAARRAGRPLPSVVPSTMQGRVALGPSQLVVVAVLVALGLAVTAWWVVRGDPRQVAAPVAPAPAPGLAVPATDVDGGAAPTVAGGPSPTGGRVTVDVAGKVRRPGIVVLAAGSRVVDAIEAAGGAGPRVDLTGLNLARILVDGEQVLVGLAATVPPGVAGSATSTLPAPAGSLVNLNAATATELEALPEVGPVTAAAIIAWRDEHGGFTAVEELLEVDGIGEATLATITPHVTV